MVRPAMGFAPSPDWLPKACNTVSVCACEDGRAAKARTIISATVLELVRVRICFGRAMIFLPSFISHIVILAYPTLYDAENEFTAACAAAPPIGRSLPIPSG